MPATRLSRRSNVWGKGIYERGRAPFNGLLSYNPEPGVSAVFAVPVGSHWATVATGGKQGGKVSMVNGDSFVENYTSDTGFKYQSVDIEIFPKS